jgi:hypothetical protein
MPIGGERRGKCTINTKRRKKKKKIIIIIIIIIKHPGGRRDYHTANSSRS